MEIANMNMGYAPAKIVIGTFEFSSEEYGIDSINIINGCYDGSVVGIGAVYSQAVTIEMSFIDGISKGERFSLYFKIHNSWTRYGTFWVDDCPTRNGNKMTINAHGVIGECGNRELIFSGKNQTYTLKDVKDQIESITGCKIIFWPLLDSSDINAFLGQKVCFLKEINDFIDGKDIKTGISVRTAIAGLAILFGGNAFEDDDVIRIKAKSYTTKQYTFTKDDYTADYQYSQFQYAIRSISLSFLPWTLGFYYPPGVSGQICTVDYLGNERVQNLLLGSGITGYTLYDYTIECDWIGWTNDGGVFDRYTPPGGKAKGCYIQGDLIYRTGSFSFPGYNRAALYPGNIISIEVDEEDNAIDLYCGEIELSWDGGFTTKVSCECNIDGTNTSYSASGSTHAEATAAQSAGAVNLQKISFADITFSNVKDSTISGSKFIDGSITGSKFADGSITNSKIADSEITGSKIKDSTLTNSLFKDGTIDGSKIKDSTLTNSLFVDGTIENSKIKDSTITGSKFVDGTIENSKIKDSTLTGAKIEDATIGFEKVNTSFIENLTADKAYIDNLNARIGDFGFITANSADLKYATITSLQATDGRIDTLESKAITTDNLEAKVATLGYLSAESADVKFATIESLTAVDGKIDTLSSKAITTENLSSKVAELGYLSAESAEIGYAKIDFSNVGTQVVSSSMIIDGAVTNEKVANLSANKITSGTIDASKITVTNLNADNITVGTINGQRIGNKSLSLDKLAEEVPTKEYLDSVQANLQGQIDGAIETFTKSEIPTLNNEPANAWTDNETRKKHIGDVCYVLNPASSANGYCYRFANTGTESSPSYEWVLIKDSDVTKALQDIIDINGEITGIKQFDTEISSWKTNTDAELSSLKSKTTTLETDMGSKVESSVFNELKQTVDENSSSITSLSTTVSKKADSSTVEELTNTVNSVKQTADKNTSSISSMQTEIGKKADGSTVTELSTRTSKLEQNLDGFKTEVSKTYTTKTELDNLEIGGRNLIINSSRYRENSPFTHTSASQDGVKTLPIDVYMPCVPGETYTFQCKTDGIWGWHDTNGTGGGKTHIFLYLQTANEVGTAGFASVGDLYSNEYQDKTGRGVWTYTIPTDKEYVRIVFRVDIHSDGSTPYTVNWWDLKAELGNKATDWTPAPEDTEEEIESVQTIAEQTADKFSWLVKSGTSATDFTLTDRTATLVSDYINLNGLVTFSGLNSDAQNKINSAENAVNNLEIGGRNLLKFTDKMNVTYNLATGISSFNKQGLTNTADGAKLTFNNNANTSFHIPLANEGSTENGQKVTLSFDYRGNIDSFGYFFFIQKTFPNVAITGFPELVISETEWQHYEHTFSSDDSNARVCTSILMFYNLEYYGSDKWVEIKKGSLKLEKGNKATDWTPAPEDISVENIYTPNTTTIDGGKITTGSIKADKIDVKDLFAQDITATGTITGATLKGANADIQKGFIGPFAISDSGMNYTGDNYSFAIEKNGIEISDKIGIVFPRSVCIAKDLIQMDNKYCMATIREDYHTEDATHPFSFEVSRFLDGSGGSYTYKQTESTWYTIDGIHTQVLKDRSDGIIEINTSSFLMDVMSLDVSGVVTSKRGFECNKTEGLAILAADSEGGKLQLQGSGNLYEIDAAGGILRFIDATANSEIALLDSNGFYPKGELVVASNKTIRFGNYQSDYMIRGTDNSITIGDKDENGNSGYVNLQGDTRVLTGSFNAPTIKEGGVSLSNKYCYYQEGTGSVSGGASWKAVTVAFPVEYNTKPFVMVVQNCATTTENIWVTEVTTQGIAFQMHTPTSGWTYEYRWMAIGIKK